jgi:hypothetical protein
LAPEKQSTPQYIPRQKLVSLLSSIMNRLDALYGDWQKFTAQRSTTRILCDNESNALNNTTAEVQTWRPKRH